MRDLLNVFFGFGDRRKSVYNLVNTNDTFPGSNSPYNPTTTALNEQNKTSRSKNESLNAVAAIDRLIFKGKLSQEENKTKSASFIAVVCDANISRKTIAIGLNFVEEFNEKNLIYVDKTEFALKLLQKAGKFFLLTRPRGFGVTLFINTLRSILLGKREVFKDYFIGDPQNGYSWNAHTVLRLTFQRDSPIKSLASELVTFAKHSGLDKALAHIEETSPLYFEMLLRELSPNYKDGSPKPGKKPPLALLIDDYSLPFDNADDETREYFSRILSSLKTLKNEDIVQFMYLTGCSKANLLDDDLGAILSPGAGDISLDGEYASVCGFTEDEVKKYFDVHVQRIADKHKVTKDMIYDKMEHWYHGYRFTPDSSLVYNPISLLSYLKEESILTPDNYWARSVNHSNTVIETIIETRVRSKSIILNLDTDYSEDVLFQPVEDTQVSSFVSRLFQGGYLTIFECHDKSYTLKFPNMEIMKVFCQLVEQAMKKDDECCALHRKAKSSLQKMNIDVFVETFNTFLKERYLVLVKNNTREYEALLKIILRCLLRLGPPSENRTPEWNVRSQVFVKNSNGKGGQPDFIIQTSTHTILIECKYGKMNDELEKTTFVSDGRGKTLVKLLLNFDESGIRQWIGAKYGAQNNFISNLSQDERKKSKKSNDSNTRFPCNQCRPVKYLSSKFSLERHNATFHSNSKMFKCDFRDCGEVFNSQRSLSLHKNIHARNKATRSNLVREFNFE